MNGTIFGWETPAAMLIALLPPSETLLVRGSLFFTDSYMLTLDSR